MSNGLTSHTTTWNRIRESIMGSEVFTSQIKSYLKNAQVKQAGEDSLVLLLPNSLTEELIDKSGILAFIHASFLDETGLDIAISTEVTSLEDFPVASPSPTPEPRMTPNIIKGEKGIDVLETVLRALFKGMGEHIQINVVDNETLRDAQVHPEKYRNMLVRVAGYSAFFVDLDKSIQENIIERTIQRSV